MPKILYKEYHRLHWQYELASELTGVPKEALQKQVNRAGRGNGQGAIAEWVRSRLNRKPVEVA